MKRSISIILISLILFLQTGTAFATEEKLNNLERDNAPTIEQKTTEIKGQIQDIKTTETPIQNATNTVLPAEKPAGPTDQPTPPTDETKPAEKKPEDVKPQAPPDEEKQQTPMPKPQTDPWKNVQGFESQAGYDLFTGEFHFQVPFSFPASQTTPSLSLNYSSLNKNFLSQTGLGFSLDAGAIYRLTNQGSDNIYNQNDEFAVKTSNSYEEIISVGNNVYLDKYDRSFTKYYFDQTKNSWTAEDNSGNLYFFGQTKASRQYDPENETKTFAWQLDKITNLKNDQIEFTYFQDANQIYLQKIKYGFYKKTDGSLTNLYEIELSYHKKDSSMESYITAFKIETFYLLEKIQVKYQKPDGNFENIKSYVLTYDSLSEAISKLVKVEEEAVGLDLAPLEFEYYNPINLLKKIKNNRGGEIEANYLPSTFYVDPETGEHNQLPFIVQTLHELHSRDLLQNTETVATISYYGGNYYYSADDIFGRQYAGFYKVETLDKENFQNRYYFHQSETSTNGASLGETDDHISKKGRIFRQETYNQENLLTNLKINKWLKKDLLDGQTKPHYFVYLDTKVIGDIYKDEKKYQAQKYEYDNFGNLIKTINYNEITPSNDLAKYIFTDTNTADTLISLNTYAKTDKTNFKNFTSLNYKTTLYKSGVSDANKLNQTINYFDDQAEGFFTLANLTKSTALLKTDYGSKNNYGNKIKLTNRSETVTLQQIKYSTCNNFLLPSQIIDAKNNSTFFEYDQYCLYPKKITYPDTTNEAKQTVKHFEQFEYDYRVSQPTKIFDQNNNIFKKDYDLLGRVIREWAPRNDDTFDLVTQIVYQDKLTGPSWPAFKFTKKRDRLDLNGNDINAWHLSTEFYDGLGRISQTKTEAEGTALAVVNFAYDQRGNLFRQNLPVFSSNASYDLNADSWANLDFTEMKYDEQKRVISMKKVLAGNKTFSTSTINYFPWRQEITDSLGKTKKLKYSSSGKLIEVKEYNHSDNLGNKTTDLKEFLTKYDYDVWGNLSKITDAENNIRNFTYDNFGRNLSLTDLHYPSVTDFGTYYFLYDNVNLIGKITPKLDEIKYDYDQLNRIQKEDLLYSKTLTATDLAVIDNEYFYDSTAEQTATLNPNTKNSGINQLAKTVKREIINNKVFETILNFEYDKLGRNILQTKNIKTADTKFSPISRMFKLETEYDVLSRVTKVLYPNYLIRNSYNNGLNLEKTFKTKSGEQEQVIISNLNYGPNGLITKQTNANGTETNNIYDPNDFYRLTGKITKDKSGKNIQNLSYVYDTENNVSKITDTSENKLKKISVFEYDDLYRLTKSIVTGTGNNQDYIEDYKYSPTGNIFYKSDQGDYKYAKDIAGTKANPQAVIQILDTKTKAIKKKFAYDLNGNQITSQEITGGVTKTTSYQFNYKNELIYAVPPANQIYFIYDVTGARSLKLGTKRINYYPFSGYEIENDGSNEKTSYSLNDTAKEILTKASTSLKTVLGSNKLIKSVNNIFYTHEDHLGSSSVTTNSLSTIVDLVDYYPFGSVRLEETDASFENDYLYTGKERDEEIGLYYYGARYYDGSVGRFVSVDPVQVTSERLINSQGLNLYNYATNNPIKYLDPSGMYNVETGLIEKGDTEDKIVQTVEKAFNIKTTWETIANVSFFKENYETTDIKKLIEINESRDTNKSDCKSKICTYVGTNDVRDITNQLDTLNEVRANTLLDITNESIRFSKYVILFREKGPWDIKNSNDPILGGGKNNRKFWAYLYHGELIRYDAPGNINYGYVGNAIDVTLNWVLLGAGIVQSLENKSLSGDNGGDAYYIKKGYKMFIPKYYYEKLE